PPTNPLRFHRYLRWFRSGAVAARGARGAEVVGVARAEKAELCFGSPLRGKSFAYRARALSMRKVVDIGFVVRFLASGGSAPSPGPVLPSPPLVAGDGRDRAAAGPRRATRRGACRNDDRSHNVGLDGGAVAADALGLRAGPQSGPGWRRLGPRQPRSA